MPRRLQKRLVRARALTNYYHHEKGEATLLTLEYLVGRYICIGDSVTDGVVSEMEKPIDWRSLLSSSFVLLLPSLSLMISHVYATETLLPGQILNANQSLVSKNGAFKLGYYCDDNPEYPNFCSWGIWFANSSSCRSGYIPVWYPHLDSDGPGTYTYFSSSSTISVSEEGLVHITDRYSTWSSTSYMTATSISAVAVLLDNGNLVVRDKQNSSMVVWQSFDSPTTILLPGGYLGFNRITGKSATLAINSYSFGVDSLIYTLSFDSTRRRGFIIQQNHGGPTFAGTFPGWMDIHEDGDYALTFNVAHTYIQLDRSGFIRLAKHGECDFILWSAPDSLCDFDSYCGPYSLCTTSGSCVCPDGFYPLSTSAWIAAGCSRTVPLNCGNVEVTFHPIDGIHAYPQNALKLEAANLSECQSSCLRDCTCTAFSYNTSCLLWFWELRNTVVLDSGLNGNRMYIRIATNQQSGSRTAPLFSFRKRVVLGSTIGVIAVLAITLILLLRCRRKLFKTTTIGDDGSLMVFSFVQIKNSTKTFSEKLGEGGFGCVFKGVLPGCTVVAVKKLKCLRQEDKQFRAELQTIGMIQHINIVRLLGFCAEDRGRFLVYEYMPNGSLSNHLFSKSSSMLSWEQRYSIALGIARGLAYLHEECKDCIVHCDMKPDNVLLDAELCPKIADFGMAKLLGRDFSRALTTMRGTIGYLAPEWISGLPITHKADVYSYGMMLLEIISGRRNSEKIKEGMFTYFPIYAAVKVSEGDVMRLSDSRLDGNVDAEQLERACRAACWCIQDDEDHRPMMGQVVHMLEGVMDVQVPPVPRSLQNYVGMEDSTSAGLDSF